MNRKLTDDQVILLGQLAAAKWELNQAEMRNSYNAINVWARLVQKKKEMLIKEIGLEDFQQLAKDRKLAV